MWVVALTSWAYWGIQDGLNFFISFFSPSSFLHLFITYLLATLSAGQIGQNILRNICHISRGYSLSYLAWKMLYQHGGHFQPLRNSIAMLDINRDITCVLRLFAVRNDLLHWLCTSKLILKRHVLSSVWFRGCSIWEQHLPWCTVIFPVVSATGLDQVPPWVELKGCHICSTGWPDMLICKSSPAISITPIRVIRDFESKRRGVTARLAVI